MVRKIKKRKFMGIENPKFRRIRRNRDDGGYILTYTTFHGNKHGKFELEHNTIGKAKLMALKIDEKKKRRSKK